MTIKMMIRANTHLLKVALIACAMIPKLLGSSSSSSSMPQPQSSHFVPCPYYGHGHLRSVESRTRLPLELVFAGMPELNELDLLKLRRVSKGFDAQVRGMEMPTGDAWVQWVNELLTHKRHWHVIENGKVVSVERPLHGVHILHELVSKCRFSKNPFVALSAITRRAVPLSQRLNPAMSAKIDYWKDLVAKEAQLVHQPDAHAKVMAPLNAATKELLSCVKAFQPYALADLIYHQFLGKKNFGGFYLPLVTHEIDPDKPMCHCVRNWLMKRSNDVFMESYLALDGSIFAPAIHATLTAQAHEQAQIDRETLEKRLIQVRAGELRATPAEYSIWKRDIEERMNSVRLAWKGRIYQENTLSETQLVDACSSLKQQEKLLIEGQIKECKEQLSKPGAAKATLTVRLANLYRDKLHAGYGDRLENLRTIVGCGRVLQNCAYAPLLKFAEYADMAIALAEERCVLQDIDFLTAMTIYNSLRHKTGQLSHATKAANHLEQAIGKFNKQKLGYFIDAVRSRAYVAEAAFLQGAPDEATRSCDIAIEYLDKAQAVLSKETMALLKSGLPTINYTFEIIAKMAAKHPQMQTLFEKVRDFKALYIAHINQVD